ncbi:MAG: AMP phosphorylase [Candidatus Heimdallarchaeota archaeon]|nr:AMP phosphorylase [Candidatus Heimdallarchaeota archaeon]MDH5644452.1 AMP phosphorylase [Candidatus Heimdallarchaeota archaeon]
MEVKILDFDTTAEIVFINPKIEDPRDSLSNLAQIKIGPKKQIVQVIRSELVKENEIGLPTSLAHTMKAEHGDNITINPRRRTNVLNTIMKKYDRQKWSSDDLRSIIDEMYTGNVTDLEMAAFTLAMQYEDLSTDETEHLTRSFTLHSEQIDFGEPVYDKHSIGGIPGNKVSLLIVPIIAAAGLLIPKTSSRAITSPSGTADTMEVLCNVGFNAEEIMEIAPKTRGMLVWGGQLNLAPVDSQIIKRVERPLSLDPKSVIIASILSKKLSTGVDHMVLDMPTGAETKMESRAEAKELSHLFVEIGRRVGIKIDCALTYADQPVGHAIGPALEAREALLTLDGKGPRSVLEKSNELAGILLEMAGVASRGKGAHVAEEYVKSGKALEKFYEIIEAQGGSRILPKDIPVGQYTSTITAKEDGYISHISNKQIKNIAATLGCPSDKSAGLYIHRKKGEFVKKGDVILELYSTREGALDDAMNIAKLKSPFLQEGMVLERISSSPIQLD